eukprot:CAMPEP_0201528688 /NCGR_PEP_ID=MMETSP0161_2-20130828/39259_1 /ASSEMBLY_ACC=CAM_ASM_000251 /TAXON_ID=180227 /ORGANISM="Neoparamoeba aestuarina, Strain SoJaBio B1-5/56/2" /LENGTH=266 /DNA_ID=CAMNT_0047930111 /DNA_START=57 /DNA_END=853 /DNA_ORIENTATION=-
MKKTFLGMASSIISSSRHPFILQYPSRQLFQKIETQISGDAESQIGAIGNRLLKIREYYEFPALSAAQIGTALPIFVANITPNSGTFSFRIDAQLLSGMAGEKLAEYVENSKEISADKTPLSGVHICGNPECLWTSQQTCFAWEACASYSFLMHYIERPKDIIAKWVDVNGNLVVAKLSGIGSRLFQHEMDHMNGIPFYTRIPNRSHAVPISGFRTMSQWKDDFPSIEARSTYLYTIYTPPFTFETETPVKSSFLERAFDNEVYPG